jgi:hypothetical protein
MRIYRSFIPGKLIWYIHILPIRLETSSLTYKGNMDLRIISMIEVTAICATILGGLGILLLAGTRTEIIRRRQLRSWPIAGTRIRRAGGMVLAALALLTIVNSVFMVRYNSDDLAYASSLPALIPASTREIIAGLENGLGLNCKPDNSDVYGPAIGYKISVCGSVDPGLPMVWIFSRICVPDKVDFVQVTPGTGAKDIDWITLGKVAVLTTQVPEAQLVRIWVSQIAPRVLTRGGETKLSIGRVNYQLYVDGNSPHTKVKLEIGTKQ